MQENDPDSTYICGMDLAGLFLDIPSKSMVTMAQYGFALDSLPDSLHGLL